MMLPRLRFAVRYAYALDSWRIRQRRDIFCRALPLLAMLRYARRARYELYCYAIRWRCRYYATLIS